MARNLLLASAGAGKTKLVAEKALAHATGGDKVLLLTYTINNQAELVRHICSLKRVHPKDVVVKGWFSFLLEDMVRPYQRCILPERVSGIVLNASNPHLKDGKFVISGRKEKVEGEYNPLHFVTKSDNSAYTYFLAKLAARIHKETGGKSAERLACIYRAVFIDEVQDLVGWDFDVMQAIAKTNIDTFECVGDFRQTVYSTSDTSKLPKRDAEKLAKFEEMGFTVEHLSISWRCIQSICDLADRLHANDGHYTLTKSRVCTIPPEFAEHQGVFAVPASRIEDYLARYNNTVILRWNRLSKKIICQGRTAYNFGEAKGLGFDRVLILTTDKHAKFLSGDHSAFLDDDTDDARNKLYVGITRARYSVAFWYDGGSIINGAQVWNPND